MIFYKKIAFLCALIVCSSNTMALLNWWQNKPTQTQTRGFQITPEQRKRIENEIKKIELDLLITKCVSACTWVGLTAASLGLLIYGHGLCAQGIAPDPVPKGVDPTTLEPNYQYVYSTLLTGSIVALSIPALMEIQKEKNELEKHLVYLKRSLPAQPNK